MVIGLLHDAVAVVVEEGDVQEQLNGGILLLFLVVARGAQVAAGREREVAIHGDGRGVGVLHHVGIAAQLLAAAGLGRQVGVEELRAQLPQGARAVERQGRHDAGIGARDGAAGQVGLVAGGLGQRVGLGGAVGRGGRVGGRGRLRIGGRG
ncbi:hypothetical protein D1643_04995, partial [Enterorhabdus sp. P55]|nr:hypothetical protein [Enterorhabdus sp. P55]